MFCLNHLAQLGRMYEEIQRYGTEVMAIGGAARDTAARVARTFKTPFRILADPERQVYAAYGFGKVALIVQQSGIVLIDRAGIVQYAHHATNPQHALRREALRQALRMLDR